MNLESIHKYFSPEDLDFNNDELVWKATTFISATLTAAIYFFIYAILYYIQLDSFYILVSHLSCSASLLSLLFIYKKTGKFEIISHLTATIILIGINSSTLCLGREKSMGIIYLMGLPLIVGLLLNVRALIFWTFMAGVSFFFQKYFAATYLSHLAIPLSDSTIEKKWTVNFFGYLGLVLTFCLIYMSGLKRMRKLLIGKTEETHQLLRVISHDIRNPLNIIQMSNQRLERSKSLSEAEERILNKSIQATEMVGRITEKVVLLESLQSGKLRIEMEKINLKTVIDELSLLFESKIKVKKIKFVIEGDSNVSFMGEKVSITHQIFANIISNSIKFSRNGDRIIFKIFPKEKSGFIHIRISDNGIGIPDHLLKNIFSKTVPTTRAGTKNETGTGFGMPIVRDFIELFEGKINITSQDIATNPADSGTDIDIYFKAP